MVNSEQRDQSFHVAQAAARQLLVRTIDIRFDLDDAAEAFGTGLSVTPFDLQRLRTEADALCRAIDDLSQALRPLDNPVSADEEEEESAATTCCA